MFPFVHRLLGWVDRIEMRRDLTDTDLTPLLSCEVITSFRTRHWTPKYFSMFKMEPFHQIISAIFFLLCVLLSPAKLNKFGARVILLIGFCCDSGSVWRTVIDWLVWFGRKNPNNTVSPGDVTASTPGAKVTECIAEARRNSAHTHQSSAARPSELF